MALKSKQLASFGATRGQDEKRHKNIVKTMGKRRDN